MRKILPGVVAALTFATAACGDGTVTTDTGLHYVVLREGDGPNPTETDRVIVHYRGMLSDSTVFDSSYDRGQPASFLVSQMIPGFKEALLVMSPGSHVRITIPPELGYGDTGIPGTIPPNATLIFEIEMEEILGR